MSGRCDISEVAYLQHSAGDLTSTQIASNPPLAIVRRRLGRSPNQVKDPTRFHKKDLQSKRRTTKLKTKT